MHLKKIYPIVLGCLYISLPAYAEHVTLPDLTVETAAGEESPLTFTTKPGSLSDSAEQLKNLPGANINRNGPLTSIAQYRGMFSDRVNVLVDGVRISQAGPNSMDSPLSYISASQLDSLTLYRGIAPVSSGIETIGGTIAAKSKQAAFSQSEAFQVSGEANAGYAHNNDSHQLGLTTSLSNNRHRLNLHASRDQGDDQRFDGGKIILPSQHERDSVGIGYGFQNDTGLLASIDIEHHDTGNTGTPALPMDILFARGERYKTLISQTLANGDKLSLRLNYQDADHLMNNFSLRPAPMPAMHRQAYTDVIAYGAQLHYQHQNWLFGL